MISYVNFYLINNQPPSLRLIYTSLPSPASTFKSLSSYVRLLSDSNRCAPATIKSPHISAVVPQPTSQCLSWLSPPRTAQIHIRPPAFRVHKSCSIHPIHQSCRHRSLTTIQKSHPPHVPQARLHLPPAGPTVCAPRHLTHPPTLQEVIVHIPLQIRHLRVLALIYQTSTRRPLRL